MKGFFVPDVLNSSLNTKIDIISQINKIKNMNTVLYFIAKKVVMLNICIFQIGSSSTKIASG
jgi:hypothetical protein